MRCHLASAGMQDLLEGRISEGEAQELRLHLASCRQCQVEFESWRNLWALLADLPPCKAAPHLELRILPRLTPAVSWPRGLVAVFALAGLSTICGLLPWADTLEARQDLLSAFLWAIAGVACATSVWLAVASAHRPSHPQEE